MGYGSVISASSASVKGFFLGRPLGLPLCPFFHLVASIGRGSLRVFIRVTTFGHQPRLRPLFSDVGLFFSLSLKTHVRGQHDRDKGSHLLTVTCEKCLPFRWGTDRTVKLRSLGGVLAAV